MGAGGSFAPVTAMVDSYTSPEFYRPGFEMEMAVFRISFMHMYVHPVI